MQNCKIILIIIYSKRFLTETTAKKGSAVRNIKISSEDKVRRKTGR